MAQYIQVGNDIIEFPDDMSSEQITSILSKQGGQATAPSATTSAAPAKKTPSIVEQMIGPGSPSYSLFRGLMIEPVLGVNEMLAKTGLFGETIKAGASENVRQERAVYEAGRTAMGREGFDVPQLAGAIFLLLEG